MTKPQTPFPPPLIIPPLHLPHKQTFILLHGRGSNASKFGPVLLTTPFPPPTPSPLSQTPSSPPQTLATAFPHAKFIFPTAPYRRATIYKRTLITQWFDNWHLDFPPSDSDPLDITTNTPQRPPRPAKNDWMMIDGLRETTAHLHALVREEVALLRPAGGRGARDIVLGGISQGCAASLVAAALWGCVGGCLLWRGWWLLVWVGGVICLRGVGRGREGLIRLSGMGRRRWGRGRGELERWRC